MYIAIEQYSIIANYKGSANMQYIILLRKINVGKDNRITKNDLRALFVNLEYESVDVYINSGNVIIKTDKPIMQIKEDVKLVLFEYFHSDIKFLIKTKEDMKSISAAIPSEWQNDDAQKTDIAYLFEDIDSPTIINQLPLKMEYINIIYVKGALIWNVLRENQRKSGITKIITQDIYKFMTVRNVNTARYLGTI